MDTFLVGCLSLGVVIDKQVKLMVFDYERENKFENDFDVENYKAEENTFGSIVLKQFQRCLNEGSKEMVEGGVSQRLINGEIVDIYEPNQIEVFVNSVKMLHSLLLNNLNKDKTIKNRIEEYNRKEEEINEEYNKNIGRNTTRMRELENLRYSMTREKIRTELSKSERASLLYKSIRDRKRVELYRFLLDTISIFLNNKNYFNEEEDVK